MPHMRRQDRIRLAEWADVFNLQEQAYTEDDHMMEDRAGVVQFEDEMEEVNSDAESRYWETHPLR